MASTATLPAVPNAFAHKLLDFINPSNIFNPPVESFDPLTIEPPAFTIALSGFSVLPKKPAVFIRPSEFLTS